jgi:nitrite reductase (NADH) small subunit
MNKVIVCNIDELKEGRGKRSVVNDEEIALFKVDEQICAISNMCPHQKFQKLHDGLFENGIVTCPMHGWAYDVRTGISTNASGRVKTFKTEVKNGKVFLKKEEG